MDTSDQYFNFPRTVKEARAQQCENNENDVIRGTSLYIISQTHCFVIMNYLP